MELEPWMSVEVLLGSKLLKRAGMVHVIQRQGSTEMTGSIAFQSEDRDDLKDALNTIAKDFQ